MNSLSTKNVDLKKYEFKRLCNLLGVSRHLVDHVVKDIDSQYKEWSEDKVDRLTGKTKTYLDGTVKRRTFRNPSNLLKAIQRRINERLLDQIPLPSCVHGGVKTRSNITNAKLHQGNKFIFTTDLKDFFPSITAKRVYNTLTSLEFSPNFAHWLTRLTTWKNELPQGAPTSTYVANLCFLQTDAALALFCKEHSVVYTRFVDDLTFSSQRDFRSLIPKLIEIIKHAGVINHRKTRYNGNQTVTGIKVFLNKIDAPELIIQKARNEKVENSLGRPYSTYLQNIRKTNKAKGTRRPVQDSYHPK
ncbi:MAG: reverse transcriptase family protein [Bacteroidota bacterium]